MKKNELETVSLSNNITEIKEGAFYNNRLTKITLPSNLKVIGDLAFWNNNLTEIVLPNSLEMIGLSAFESNKLSEVRIPTHNLVIGEFAFAGNKENALEFVVYGQCDSTASEYAENNGHTMLNLSSMPCNLYIKATDADFEFVESNESGSISFPI